MNWIHLAVAWTLFSLMIWSIGRMVKDVLSSTRRLHQIPCAHCQFFTDNYVLKCAVHPEIALTEEATHCPDYYPWAAARFE